MKIGLRFDFDSYVLFVPDGYIKDIHVLQLDFFDWLYDQPQNEIICSGNQLGVSYNQDDFVKYINTVVLNDCNEKAYITGDKKRLRTKYLHF